MKLPFQDPAVNAETRYLYPPVEATDQQSVQPVGSSFFFNPADTMATGISLKTRYASRAAAQPDVVRRWRLAHRDRLVQAVNRCADGVPLFARGHVPERSQQLPTAILPPKKFQIQSRFPLVFFNPTG